jgi:hypothetical protein
MAIVPPPGIDFARTTLWFEVALEFPGAPPTLRVQATGRTWVERGQAIPSGDGRFEAPLRMLAMPHTAVAELLGGLKVDIRSDLPSFGALSGQVDASGTPILDVDHPGTSWFELHLIVQTPMGVVHSNGVAALVENHRVTSIFPDTPYTHNDAAGQLKLFLAGAATVPVGALGPGEHKKADDRADASECCRPSDYKVMAPGHQGCFELATVNETRRVLFADPRAPVKRGSVVTIGNEGPGPMSVTWDSGHDRETRRLPPCSSYTVLSAAAVGVAGADSEPHSRGWYIVSRCCD